MGDPGRLLESGALGNGQGSNEEKQWARGAAGSLAGCDGVGGPSLRRKLGRQTAQVCWENNDQEMLAKAGHLKKGHSENLGMVQFSSKCLTGNIVSNVHF